MLLRKVPKLAEVRSFSRNAAKMTTRMPMTMAMRLLVKTTTMVSMEAAMRKT